MTLSRRSVIAGLLALAAPAWAGGLEDGEAAWSRGDVAGARKAWETALAAEKDPARRVDLLLRLAGAEREQGLLAEAGRHLDQAEATGLLAGRVANDRGLWLLAGGDATAAAARLTTAFETAQKAGDPALAATAANNLGLARTALGRPEEAEKAFAAAEKLFAALGDRLGRADALTNTGLARKRAGRLREARAALEEAVTLFADDPGAIDARNDLGVVLQALGLDDDAAKLYEAALAQARDPRRRGALLANLATVHHRRGDETSAARRYDEAVSALESAGRSEEALAVSLQRALLGTPTVATYRALHDRARDPRTRAIAALNLGGLLWRDDPTEAKALAAEARSLSEESGVRWRADHLEGRVALAAGDRPEALRLLGRAVETLERTRRDLGEAEARGFRTANAAVYEALVEASLGGDQRAVAAAAERLALADHDAPPVPDDPAAADLRALTDRQRWLEDQLATAPSGSAPSLRAQLASVQGEIATRIDVLRASYPHFAELVRTDPEDLEAVRAELPTGVVVLQPVQLPDKLVLLVYRRERLALREVPIGAEDLGKKVMKVARSLRAADTWDPEWTKARCDELGTSLWAPVADELAGATTVVVSATGVFRQLPFAILRHEGRWLAEAAAVANVTHVGSLRGEGARFKAEGRKALFVGNPDGSLPGAEAEARALSGRFGGSKLLVGGEGGHDAVLGAAQGRSLVHLATHGVLDPATPDRSHIVLAGYPAPEGRLAYREIPGLGSWLADTRVVVLSACESGLPSDAVSTTQPSLAINGLAGQFRRAGVETLVASLWKVSDDGTLALMTAFYERLGKGDDLATALRGAQRTLLAGALAHPYYWAPFIVVGDWR